MGQSGPSLSCAQISRFVDKTSTSDTTKCYFFTCNAVKFMLRWVYKIQNNFWRRFDINLTYWKFIVHMCHYWLTCLDFLIFSSSNFRWLVKTKLGFGVRWVTYWGARRVPCICIFATNRIYAKVYVYYDELYLQIWSKWQI